jgi:hypothetical protein
MQLSCENRPVELIVIELLYPPCPFKALTLGNETAIVNQVSWSDPLVIATIALAGATFVLALFTWRVLNETKKARTEPIFALEPAGYLTGVNEAPGEKFLQLRLVNHGAPATDMKAEIGWFENEKSSGSSRTFYILSLAKDGYAELYLAEHLNKITSEKLYIKVTINCKDAAGKDCQKIITNGLDKIRGTSIKMASQYSYWQRLVDALNHIAQK